MAYIPEIAKLIRCEEGQRLYDIYEKYLNSKTEESFGKKMADSYYNWVGHLIDCRECHYEKPNFLKNEVEDFSDNLEVEKGDKNG